MTMNNAQTGAMLGAVLGGVAGNQIGEGEGRTVATIAGTMLGSYLGSQYGAQFDARDQQQLSQSLYSGRPASWQNPTTGYSYKAIPGQAYRTQNTNCRPVSVIGTIDGRQQNVQMRACQDASGQWQAVN
jgi:surface antigen